MEKIIKLLTLSQSFSKKEKFLIYKIAKYNPEKREKIFQVLNQEKKDFENIKNNFFKKIANSTMFFVKNYKKEKNENIFNERKKFILQMQEMEKMEKFKENLDLEKIFL